MLWWQSLDCCRVNNVQLLPSSHLVLTLPILPSCYVGHLTECSICVHQTGFCSQEDIFGFIIMAQFMASGCLLRWPDWPCDCNKYKGSRLYDHCWAVTLIVCMCQCGRVVQGTVWRLQCTVVDMGSNSTPDIVCLLLLSTGNGVSDGWFHFTHLAFHLFSYCKKSGWGHSLYYHCRGRYYYVTLHY